MAVTPNYSIPYPALTDAPNGPAQMQALATQVDTSLAAVAAKKTQAGLTEVWANGVSDISVLTTNTTLVSVTIADPGWPYKLRCSGQVDYYGYGTFTAGAGPYCLGFVLLDSPTSGTVISQANGFPQSSNATLDGFTTLIDRVHPNGSTSLTGAHTVYLVARGSIAMGCRYSSFTGEATYLNVDLIPA
jgi:hypothetical protein